MSTNTGAAYLCWGNFFSGDTVPQVTIAATDEAQAPIDFTGYTVEARFNDPAGGAVVATPAATVSGTDITVASFQAPTVERDRVFNYVIKLTTPGGDVKTWLFGDLIVNADFDRIT